jgi:CO dehydrogenase maturation factor
LRTGMKIAICGKGGVGKTTVCAVWAHLFAQDGFEVLAIDADSNPNLSLAFGVAQEKIPPPLIEMKELIQERTESQSGAVGQYFKLNPHVADLPEKYGLDIEGIKLPAIAGQDSDRATSDRSLSFPPPPKTEIPKRIKLLILGSIEQAGSGCACPEGAFLKALLSYSILQRQEMILVDLEAGVEFLGRACVQGVDALVVVVEPGSRSIEAARRIAQMAGEMGIDKVAAVANKITSDKQLEIIKEQLGGIEVLGGLRYEQAVQEADFERRAVVNADPNLLAELARAKDRLTKFLSPES